MGDGRRVRWGLPLLLVAVAAAGVMAWREARPRPLGESHTAVLTWRTHLESVDAAVAAGDVGGALGGWQDAHLAALASRSWEAMVAIGDTHLRSGDPTKARAAYLLALFRARAAGSLDGVLRATEPFAALGDREVVGRGLRIARDLAARDGGPAESRVREATARLADPGRTARPLVVGSF